ncbi:MAG: glucuronoarabinoxylan endo-1,4-beta-xylanase [Oscillospiraceae bacterium]|nr:glucuronoarabinoxylan endo-1,4-beta-xylanase [Oscillospiraceae bacterium]
MKTVSLKSVTAIFTSVALLMGMVATPGVVREEKVYAASDCVIDVSKSYQLIRGFGGINHPEWTGKDLSSSQRQTAFGNGSNELGMSVLRVYVNEDKNQWYKAVDTAKACIAQGGIVFASPWHPPAELCEKFTRTYKTWNGTTVTQPNQKRLRHDKYAEYAKHLNDFVLYMRSKGVDIYAISVQNEPDYAEEWTWWTSDECTEFLANYAHVIDTKVMSPETFQYANKDYYTKILNNQKAFANCDLFATHFYGTQRSQMDFPALESSGKEIWMTEVYVPNSDADSADRWPEAIKISENIHNGLVVGNMSAYVWWYIRRSYGPMKEDGSISKRGYCMAQFSKYVRPGSVRISATETPDTGLLVSAYKDDGKVVIVAINNGSGTPVQHFSLPGVNITNVDRYRTSANENLAKTSDLECKDGGFYATLPANSVSTFVITASNVENDGSQSGNQDTSQPITPDSNGYYIHDTFEDGWGDWEGRGAEIKSSGRIPFEGTEALLICDRTDSWNGAQLALSKSTFVPGKAYSFSTVAAVSETDGTENLCMTLQYVDTNGDTRYSRIATAKAEYVDTYVQLANTKFVIPEGASDMRLVIETESQTSNFYIDEVIIAKEGVEIKEDIKVPDVPNNDDNNNNNIVYGDLNKDGAIDITDITLLSLFILGDRVPSDEQKLAADVSYDGNVDLADLAHFKQYISKDSVVLGPGK